MTYQVIVIGAGHAGCEAAYVLAKRGIKVLLVTINKDKLATLPCNPSIGGPAKGVIVREIDALGGLMGKITDKTQLQVKMLNSGKGYAVQTLRAQVDKEAYSKLMTKKIKNTPNITLMEGIVEKLIIRNNKVFGVMLRDKIEIYSDYVLLTTGTYLNSRCLIGDEITISGPSGEPTSFGISKQLSELGLDVIRLKTGTPPRILDTSIDYSLATIQSGDNQIYSFSNYHKVKKYLGNVDCYLDRTTIQTKQVILDNLNKSALYGGIIEGTGPRYCPSIEDKIIRFKEHDTHQIFLEPEGLNLNTIYLQGLSTSMPRDIQHMMVNSVASLKDAQIVKYAYAIEYDAVNPLEIYATLETKKIKDLFLAGQINGTSGYEEAAGQGIVAGINIGNMILNLDPFILGRNEAYIGVLIDDLINKGTKEPYRMLTSRAEYRLLLRNDNADERLYNYGKKFGLIPRTNRQKINTKLNIIYNTIEYCKNTKINPNEQINTFLESIGSAKIMSPTTIFSLIKRPEIDIDEISNGLLTDEKIKEYILDIIIRIKYEGYIKKETEIATSLSKYEKFVIPDRINYFEVDNLSNEAIEKLTKIRPFSIGQASRIIGINPSDINSLLYYIREKYDK